MATVTFPDKSFILAIGPLKIEVVFLTAVVDEDTYASKLVRPLAAFMVPAADATGTTANQSATVSSQTVTLKDPATTAQTLFVIGF